MHTSDNINELAGALAKAQGAIEGAKKDSANPHFKSKYADLASIWDACRAALSANGLSIVQLPGETASGQIEMTTMLMHVSGQWISERLTIPLAKVDAQGYGSAVTYARRYALSAMVGVAPEDDDGNAAVSSNQRQGASNDRNSDRITAQQRAELEALIAEVDADPRRFCQYLKVNTIADIPADRFDAAVKALNAKRQPQKEAA